MMSEQHVADRLAQEAVAPIESGMIVGLGTGRAARRGIRMLADRVSAEKLDIRCVATSDASHTLAEELGLTVTDFAMVEEVDYTFDGADQFDRQLRLLKGAGGAMTRERMVAWASRRCVYLVDQTKEKNAIGDDMPLAIAVMAFGLASTRAHLREHGIRGVVRRDLEGRIFVTDNGNMILDAMVDHLDSATRLEALLNDIPGVVDHGMFLDEADEILIETEDGSIERIVRE
ncbi:MAG: ribose-5-phosphate isomerase RpiA [Planctomycetota bacterium]